ncbi:MAG: two component transcriptional regulator, LuxR family [Verrucomicrobia bacterium]|nr:two component transcriptional regulator, LuxR family [Verrucomicrobiota bacterium]
MFRDVMRKLCLTEFGWQVVAEADTGRKAKRVIEETRPDLVMIDLHLPDGDGFGVAEFTRLRWPQTKILLLSSHCDDFTLFRVEQASADGFVDKTTELLTALRRACAALLQGGKYYSPSYLEAQRARTRNAAAFNKILSEREYTVLSLIGGFASNEEIALVLSLAPRTAQTHRNNIMRKLGITTSAKLIEYAIEHGFSRVTTLRNGKPVMP